jgi:TetR/AcrR family transcriptional regulator
MRAQSPRRGRAGRGVVDKPTAERLLDVAEQEFAARGYAAASLVEIAGQAGIRAPSLYSHYRSKEALYLAVVERLLGKFVPLTTMLSEAVTRERVLEWLRQYVARHFEHPNLARILQHAALDGGPDTAGITQRLLGPMFREDPSKIASVSLRVLDERLLQGWAVMALNNMVMSYITMAPLYEGLIRADPLSAASRRKQQEIVVMLVAAAMDLDHRD